MTIKKGSVLSYSDVAKGINKPKAARAVANAIGKNPYAPKIPCHRVGIKRYIHKLHYFGNYLENYYFLVYLYRLILRNSHIK